eukprot:NODE_2495_length_1162_cov_19.268599_g2378_i0.p1 GENE.NODE_2495_length_1162_cov_19.268599_g2378_i0~~NODE_2495_length_1162_cov_19.268599_g2378_i0.p1  ORF type:complete len:333 (-),score=26.91 NODE_2495_length_1162_cov_19.268599_g2378_i0:82-1080(-)
MGLCAPCCRQPIHDLESRDPSGQHSLEYYETPPIYFVHGPDRPLRSSPPLVVLHQQQRQDQNFRSFSNCMEVPSYASLPIHYSQPCFPQTYIPFTAPAAASPHTLPAQFQTLPSHTTNGPVADFRSGQKCSPLFFNSVPFECRSHGPQSPASQSLHLSARPHADCQTRQNTTMPALVPSPVAPSIQSPISDLAVRLLKQSQIMRLDSPSPTHSPEYHLMEITDIPYLSPSPPRITRRSSSDFSPRRLHFTDAEAQGNYTLERQWRVVGDSPEKELGELAPDPNKLAALLPSHYPEAVAWAPPLLVHLNDYSGRRLDSPLREDTIALQFDCRL